VSPSGHVTLEWSYKEKTIRVWEEGSQPFYIGVFGDKVLERVDYSPC
jgi:hypothetical protein